MKLLSRTTYILVTTVLVTFSLGGIGFYLVLKKITDREIRQELSARMETVLKELERPQGRPGPINIPGYLIMEIHPPGAPVREGFRDTLLADPLLNTYMEHLVLSRLITVDSLQYRVDCYQSLHERYSLTERIILMVTMIVLVFFFVVYILNRYIFQRTWSDFFQTIALLRNYDVNSGKQLEFSDSSIFEFRELNLTLDRLINKIRGDYENIRQFTGNISHEIQTPLTVIRQKSENLLQAENLDEDQMRLLQEMQQSVTRLARLNKTLVLLTRIESGQFTVKEKVSAGEVILEQLEVLRPLAEANRISIDYLEEGRLILEADPALVDVLLINLLKNAMNHNVPGGRILIREGAGSLCIRNTGKQEPLDPQQVFERYHRGTGKAESLGLGLAIVKKVCSLYRIHVSYRFEEGMHCFELKTSEFLQN